ncbi:MAG: DUF4388 domain-containing protein [Oligoflexia bacterium]|nr:DUF4388 domain-containing protein [Oligoflexia bacterium]
MQTELMNQDNFADVLRGISQRRRQGTLEVRFADRAYRLVFVQGKIIEVLQPGISPAKELSKRLKAAGVLPESFELAAAGYKALWQEIQKHPVASSQLDQVSFERAVKHRVLDKLYEISAAQGAFLNFDSALLDIERDFLPSVSVGQFLLDVVSLEAEASRMAGLETPGKYLRRGEAQPQSLSEGEQVLFSLLNEPCLCEELRTRSLLSKFAFQEAVLELIEKGHIVVENDSPLLSSEEFLDKGLLDGIDASIDEAFGELAMQQENSVPEPQVLAQAVEPVLTISPSSSGPQRGAFTARVALMSARLAHNPFVPAVVVLCWVCAAVILPWLLWDSVFLSFVSP